MGSGDETKDTTIRMSQPRGTVEWCKAHQRELTKEQWLRPFVTALKARQPETVYWIWHRCLYYMDPNLQYMLVKAIMSHNMFVVSILVQEWLEMHAPPLNKFAELVLLAFHQCKVRWLQLFSEQWTSSIQAIMEERSHMFFDSWMKCIACPVELHEKLWSMTTAVHWHRMWRLAWKYGNWWIIQRIYGEAQSPDTKMLILPPKSNIIWMDDVCQLDSVSRFQEWTTTFPHLLTDCNVHSLIIPIIVYNALDVFQFMMHRYQQPVFVGQYTKWLQLCCRYRRGRLFRMMCRAFNIHYFSNQVLVFAIRFNAMNIIEGNLKLRFRSSYVQCMEDYLETHHTPITPACLHILLKMEVDKPIHHQEPSNLVERMHAIYQKVITLAVNNGQLRMLAHHFVWWFIAHEDAQIPLLLHACTEGQWRIVKWMLKLFPQMQVSTREFKHAIKQVVRARPCVRKAFDALPQSLFVDKLFMESLCVRAFFEDRLSIVHWMYAKFPQCFRMERDTHGKCIYIVPHIQALPTEDPIMVSTIHSNTCSICIQEASQCVTDCMHAYCFECIRTWRKQQITCPVCRLPILKLWTH